MSARSLPSISRLVSVEHVAEQLDCSRGHVYDLARAGAFRIVDISAGTKRTKTRIYADEVEAYIARQTSNLAEEIHG